MFNEIIEIPQINCTHGRILSAPTMNVKFYGGVRAPRPTILNSITALNITSSFDMNQQSLYHKN